MTQAIVLLAAIPALWIGRTRSQQEAFLNVYLPILLLIPSYFSLPIDGLPDPTFSDCALLPIGLSLLWAAVFKGQWKFSAMDFAVLVYAGWTFIADFYVITYSNAQNGLFEMTMMAIFPYMAGKALIEPNGLRVAFARRFVWLLFVISVVSIYEFRMGVNLFQPLLAGFFPGQSNGGWVVLLRWGFGRAAGPYGSPILMAIVVGSAYLLHRWLARAGHWEPRFKWLHDVPISKSYVVGGGLLLGLLMTFSRGPWLGLFCGLVVAWIGAQMNGKRALFRAALVLVGGVIVVYLASKPYLQGTQFSSLKVEENATAAYRAELLRQYTDIALQRPIWGWGTDGYPKIHGMHSIDNGYLLIALGSGVVGLALFVGMLLFSMVRLFTRAFWDTSLDLQERAFRFTLIGIIVTVGVSIVTAFLGSQCGPLLFLFLGWAEACCISEPVRSRTLAWGLSSPLETRSAVQLQYRTTRVVT